MCKDKNNSCQEDGENFAANNMAASGLLILAVLLAVLVYNEFANHHAMDRAKKFFEDTGLHEVDTDN